MKIRKPKIRRQKDVAASKQVDVRPERQPSQSVVKTEAQKRDADVFEVTNKTPSQVKKSKRPSAGARGALVAKKARKGRSFASRALLNTMTAIIAFNSIAAPALAQDLNAALTQNPAQTEVVEGQVYKNPLALRLADASTYQTSATDFQQSAADLGEVVSDSTKTKGVQVSIEVGNDNMPGSLVGDKHLDPVAPEFADDDGFTATGTIQVTHTSGDKQVSVQAQGSMITERRNDPGPDGYQARRNDLSEFSVSFHERFQLDTKTDLNVAYGGAIQALGDQGFAELQRGFHESTQNVLGGRTHFATDAHPEHGLQHNYTSDGLTFSPALIGGLDLVHEPFVDGILKLNAGADAFVPLGEGLGYLRAGAGFEIEPIENLVLDGGVNVTGSFVTTDKLDFINDIAGTRVGGHAGAKYLFGDKVGAFAKVEIGGFKNEPTYSIGLVFNFGGGAKAPWFQPLNR